MSYIKNAKFICANPDWKERVPKFKKGFRISEKIKNAELQISALGVYVAELNGERVGNFIMAPGWTGYENRLQYQTYDITDIIKQKNEFTIGVGSGWYASTPGFNAYPLGEYTAVIAAIKLTYECGKEEYIFTDESFEVAKSETLSSSLYDGETTDARIVPEFTERARLFDYPKERLTQCESEDVIETERIRPKKIITTPKGECVLDFGQNLTGYVEFKIRGNAGHRVKITCAEILDRYGNFYNENYRSAKSLIDYTLRDGEQIYKPKYTFFGFRYLKLENWCEDVICDNFTAIVVHSNIRRIGSFVCSHTKVNKLYENVIWSQRGNFLDIPTDCPQRDERLGWTGDAQVFCRTAMLNFDCEKFFKKWLRDLALAQYPDGGVPHVIPNVFKADHRHHSSGWGDAATVCPYELYMAYGDKDFLAEMFPVMKKWVSYIEANSEEYIWNKGFHFGDWLALDNNGEKKGATDIYLIATAYFYYSTGLVVKAGRILGEDVAHLENMLPKIKSAFIKKYMPNGKLESDTQTAHVLALHFGLTDSIELYETLSNRLIELIEEKGDTLTTGFIGTPYLLDTLTEIGCVDKAYTLLLQEKFPSWLYSVNMGSTTIWEHWDGINDKGEVWSSSMNSFNHYSYGAVAAWMYRTVCGIKYDENSPAYKHFKIEPIPDVRLGSARATLKTKHGDIVSSWSYEACGRIKYSFVIPNGTSAEVTIGGFTENLPAGEYVKYISE